MTDSDLEELSVIGCLAAASAAGYNYLLLKRTQEEKQTVFSRKRKHYKISYTERLQNQLRLRDRLAFRSKLRMNEDCYKKVLEYIRPKLTKKSTYMRDPIPVDDILSAVLIYMTTGKTYKEVENQTGISKSLLSRCIPECCIAIYDTMRNDYLKFPNSITEWENIAENYLHKWKFPLCLGSLDRIDIQFKGTKDHNLIYRNNKGVTSIVLMALADADCNFIFIDVGCAGRTSSAGVFNQSDFRKIIDDGENYFPPNQFLGTSKSLPYTVIANDQFPSRKHLLTPYPYHSKEYEKRIFNLRLNHARQTIDNSFQTLINRFAILQRTIFLRPEKLKRIVQASCVLHNFLNQHNENYINPLVTNKLNSIKPEFKENISINPEPSCVTEIKNNFAEYFCGEGKLSCQDIYV